VTEEETKSQTVEVEEEEKVEKPEEASSEASSDSGNEAQDDGPDLEAILAEFDGQNKPKDEAKAGSDPNSEQKPKKAEPEIDVNAIATLEQEVKQIREDRARDQLNRIYSELTAGVQADALDAEIFVNTKASRDSRLNELYANREANPAAWSDAMKALKKEFVKRFGKQVDKNVTDSREAVATAVQSATNAAPASELSDKDISKMSKTEFDELTRKMGVTPV